MGKRTNTTAKRARRLCLVLAAALAASASPAATRASAAQGESTTGCTTTLFEQAGPPTSEVTDERPVEVGVKVRTNGPAVLLGLRFYKAPENVGVHVGHLWSRTGELLRAVTFEDETASGWQEELFETPLFTTGPTTLVASYHAPIGRYAYAHDAFAAAFEAGGPVRALSEGEDGPNGVYAYGPAGTFPTNGHRSSNYYVDVIARDTSAPRPPQELASPARSSHAVLLTWSAPPPEVGDDAPAEYLVFRNGLHIASVPLSATSYTDRTVAPATSYSYSVLTRDSCDNVSEPSPEVVVTTPAAVQTLLGERAPASPAADDNRGVEVGVKFQTSVPGTVSGVRFYRHHAFDAGYTANLWTVDGELLATGRVIEGQGPTPGYQEVRFAVPVAIRATTTYVASYFAAGGRYAFDAHGFDEAVTNGVLTALASGDSGGNGVYRYGTSSGFPSETFAAANYWVDVRFTPSS